MPSSRDLPDLGIKPMSLVSPSLADGFFTSAPWEAQMDTYTALFKVDKQQGIPVEHRELCSMLCGSLRGKILKKNRYMYMYN